MMTTWSSMMATSLSFHLVQGQRSKMDLMSKIELASTPLRTKRVSLQVMSWTTSWTTKVPVTLCLGLS